jgi:hypothetical protein
VKSFELPEFFRANRDHPAFRSEYFLVNALQPHCRIKRMGWRGSRLRLIQFPTEFAKFLLLMVEKQCKSYIEIGVSSGGSLYTVDAYLREVFPDYGHSLGIDRINKIRYLAEYRAIHPQLEFRTMNSKHLDLEDEPFDMAFVDARHVEQWVLQDFEKVRHNCRFVGFHDIVLQGSTVGLAWERIKAQHPGRWWEFIDLGAPPEARCGIGVVQVKD